ncbi:MAG: carboxypeptidase-like regulatory domain-containing protein [Sphingobacteriaceae bacterium]|nr:carboxypeptidase-like regulatory domain-containing protein [Sphingobacteriaceae bacterium]
MKLGWVIFIFLLLAGFSYSQNAIRGIIVESDSGNVMPFVYLINKSNGNGTMSDNDGKFTLFTNINDTIICTFVGFAKKIIAVKDLKTNENGEVKIVMLQLPIQLGPVIVNTFKIRSYERDYMSKIIDESRMRRLDYFQSPISALYMSFSKEGKQIRKLAKIFEGVLIEEQVQKKLSPEILAKLTGDNEIDYVAFRKYCVAVSDEFIINNDGVELYSRVMGCYKRYKAEGRK